MQMMQIIGYALPEQAQMIESEKESLLASISPDMATIITRSDIVSVAAMCQRSASQFSLLVVDDGVSRGTTTTTTATTAKWQQIAVNL